jgi:hypothetical protein
VGTGAALYVLVVAVGLLESLGMALQRRGTLGGTGGLLAGAIVLVVAGVATREWLY